MRLSFCLVWLLAPPPTLTLGEGGQSKSLSLLVDSYLLYYRVSALVALVLS